MKVDAATSKLAILLGAVSLLYGLSALPAQAQTRRSGFDRSPNDPGPRPTTGDAGGAIPGLTTAQLNSFLIAQETFDAVDSVTGSIAGEDDEGLGPRFNLNSCVGCHAAPAGGGSSPAVNPQVRVATLHGARNVVPSFVTVDGPIREARFKRNPDGSADGGVHSLFVITGRTDAPPGFTLQQTDFASQVAANNVSLRTPTPVFGTGLIEAITDETILANKNANSDQKARLGIAGRENRSGNDGTLTRFGWKAQNKSLLMFAGEAYNVEQGVTNDLFPNARESGGFGTPLGHPESSIDLDTNGIGDIELFTTFMRLLAPPAQHLPPNVSATSVSQGRSRFIDVGCVHCHTERMTSGSSSVAALSNKPVVLFSDLLLHNMGPNLADDISQGAARGDEFRTAPLWGLGQRLFFLHDGRSTDLDDAIQQHASSANSRYADSEANRVVADYNNLSVSDQQDLLNFLRSL